MKAPPSGAAGESHNLVRSATVLTHRRPSETGPAVEALIEIARAADSTPARVALAWVQQRPGVTSTIIGARTLEQLEDNLAALQLQLSAEQIARLDTLSTPQLNFPFDFIKRSAAFSSSGATVNGVAAVTNPLSPKSEQDRF